MTFVLTALNFRLGIWVPNRPLRDFDDTGDPGNDDGKKFGGINSTLPLLRAGSLFFRELFSNAKLSRKEKYVHLSDGGHFENLGLYELVRRGIPYIIVSEAGTDPSAATQDLGNTIRRIRADFGVDIELDVSVLEPDEDGFTKQHLAVGTIRYSSHRHGILIYLRTSLTGDESVDVLHYRNRNPSFPYESTANQFFSPDQWEAYRKLGFHASYEAFRFLDEDLRARELEEKKQVTAQELFSEAQWRWDTLPPEKYRVLERINQRQEQFVGKISKVMPPDIFEQVYPEVKGLLGELKQDGSYDDPALNFRWLRMGLVFLESVWRELEVERYYRYPEIKPWINIIDRWIEVEKLQWMWPTLRTFLDSNFAKYLQRQARGKLATWEVLPKFAKADQNGAGQGNVGNVVENDLPKAGEWKIQFLVSGNNKTMKVGGIEKVTVTELENEKLVLKWGHGDFVINPGFRGAGIGSKCLDELLLNISTRAEVDGSRVDLEVDFAFDEKKGHTGWPESERIRFYQEAGFAADLEMKGADRKMIWVTPSKK